MTWESSQGGGHQPRVGTVADTAILFRAVFVFGRGEGFFRRGSFLQFIVGVDAILLPAE